ncbi:MAG: hypothetical protein FWG63_02535 [Defluviitaleaceae bacterium]|nr:hypothetical protein [Defluviitaleaceae bacterium]
MKKQVKQPSDLLNPREIVPPQEVIVEENATPVTTFSDLMLLEDIRSATQDVHVDISGKSHVFKVSKATHGQMATYRKKASRLVSENNKKGDMVIDFDTAKYLYLVVENHLLEPKLDFYQIKNAGYTSIAEFLDSRIPINVIMELVEAIETHEPTIDEIKN